MLYNDFVHKKGKRLPRFPFVLVSFLRLHNGDVSRRSNCRNCVLIHQLLLTIVFNDNSKIIKASYQTSKLEAVHQIDYNAQIFFTYIAGLFILFIGTPPKHFLHIILYQFKFFYKCLLHTVHYIFIIGSSVQFEPFNVGHTLKKCNLAFGKITSCLF